MAKKEYYRQVLNDFKALCASGQRECSFEAYCKAHGVRPTNLVKVLGGEFAGVKSIPGYIDRCAGKVYQSIYDDFKELCASGSQPGSFASYCRSRGASVDKVHYYLKDHGLRIGELPGYYGPVCGKGKCREEIPFEEVVFEEAGFLPAGDANIITVSVDGHIAVRFPADTDVAVIAEFIKRMGKEAGHVES